MSHDKDDDPKAQKGGWKTQVNGLCKFVWNSETGEFLGRTGKSWASIILYFLIFYACLALFFYVNLKMFFLVAVDDNIPTRTEFDSIMKYYPGMGFRPTPANTLIAIKVLKSESYDADIKGLDEFLAPYMNQTDPNIYADCSNGNPAPAGKVCRFDVNTLGPCTQANGYGYPDGKPCVLLKLNKIYGWTPQNVTKDNLVKEYYNSTNGQSVPPYNGHIPITCQGEVGADVDNLVEVSYYPSQGLPFNFYPYLNQEGYMAPVVMVQFTNVTRGALVMVWCKAWADNIYHDRTDLAGSVHFELLVDEK